jgi:hypothetical protein
LIAVKEASYETLTPACLSACDVSIPTCILVLSMLVSTALPL